MTNPKKNRKILNLVLAVILAVGVWLYVINVENPTSPTTVRDVPVTVTGEDVLAERDLMVTHLSAESVDLRISGRKKTLMNLNRSNVSLELDVSTITAAGDHTLTCQYEFPRNVGSDSVSISDWEDLRITVTVAQRESKEIPVRGEFIGTEAENSLAGSVTQTRRPWRSPARRRRWRTSPMPWPLWGARRSAAPTPRPWAWCSWPPTAPPPTGRTSP